MKAMFGKKIGMTRVYNDDGESIPVTVIELSPNVVHQVKTLGHDGYSAIQVGYGEQKPARMNRAQTGHLSKAKKGFPRLVGEIRLAPNGSSENQAYQVGDTISVDQVFKEKSKVDVVGTSVGKGFAGVMKRHGMKGSIRTHGSHEYFRHGGSIGCRKFPGRVFKNKRMSGQMGNVRVMQPNLEIISIRPKDNILLVRGSVPGRKHSFVFVREAEKG
jgi:large subunit ribosomal protein L3